MFPISYWFLFHLYKDIVVCVYQYFYYCILTDDVSDHEDDKEQKVKVEKEIKKEKEKETDKNEEEKENVPLKEETMEVDSTTKTEEEVVKEEKPLVNGDINMDDSDLDDVSIVHLVVMVIYDKFEFCLFGI